MQVTCILAGEMGTIPRLRGAAILHEFMFLFGANACATSLTLDGSGPARFEPPDLTDWPARSIFSPPKHTL